MTDLMPSVRVFEVDQVRLVADQLGSPDFVLLHAGGERRSVWRPVAQRLFEAGFGSLAVDQRGHGESGGSRGDGISRFSDDLAEIVVALTQPAIIVGSSLGGFCGMLASGHPEASTKMIGLVLVDVVPDPDPDRVRRFLSTTTPPLDQSPLVDDILSQAAKLREACANIKCPVLLVLAGHSTISAQEVENLATAIPQLEIVTIDGAGHLVARDKPQELADALLAFAGRLQPELPVRGGLH